MKRPPSKRGRPPVLRAIIPRWTVLSVLSPTWRSPPVAIAAVAANRLLRYPLGSVRRERTGSRRRATQETNASSFFDEDEDHNDLYRGIGTHYVNLHVGCPNPQLQTVIIDTGSSSTGFPCSSCSGECGQGHQLNPVYDESRSSCHRPLRCDECASCGPGEEGRCVVSKRYAEGSGWSGIESLDRATIGEADEEPFELRFACQTRLTGLFRTQLADGIGGLAKHPDSLWSQLHAQGRIDEPQFSLCMQNVLNDPEADAGVLVFGGTDARFHRTPMAFARDADPGGYFWRVRVLRLVVVAAGGGRPDAGASAEAADVTLAGVAGSATTPIVDSGTTYTAFDGSARAPLREAWERVTDVAFGSRFYDPADIERLPTLWFALEGAEEDGDVVWIPLPPSDYLEGRRWRMYFDGSGETVLGANFMSGHEVLFDEENRRIGFSESDCVLSDDAADVEPGPGLSGATIAAEVNGTADLGRYVSAKHCDGSVDMTEVRTPLMPNDKLHVCVESLSEDVELGEMTSIKITGKDEEEGDSEMVVVADDAPVAPSITSHEYVGDAKYILSTMVPVGKFDFEAEDAAITVEGRLTLEVAGGGARRPLDAAVGASFDVTVALEPAEAEEVGSSAAAFGTGRGGGLRSAALLAVGVLAAAR